MLLASLKKKFIRWYTKAAPFLLACISVFIVIALYHNQNSFLEAFEAQTYDLRFKNLRGPLPPSADIAIITIDEKSIAELGRYPWTRSQYVKLLEQTSDAGAKIVLFDAFFPEQETKAIDLAFSAAIKKAGNVGLATVFELDKDGRVISSLHSRPEIESAAAGIGHINLIPEDDGVNRRNKLLIEANGKLVPSLGLVGAMAALGAKEFAPGLFQISVGDRQIPIKDNDMWINYMGPPGIYPHYSFTDVIHKRIDPALLKGKVLFLGSTAQGAHDLRVTPFDKNTPGVEVHAAVADNIITGRFMNHTTLHDLFDMTLIVMLGLLTFYMTLHLRLHLAIVAAFILSCGYIWLAYWFFLQGHWMSMIYPPLAAMIALSTGSSFRYLVMDRSAREMRSMFSSYLSPKLVSRLEKDPDAAKIGGDNKDVTVLFTDIESFTSFSEKHPPQVVVARLNEYLAAMVQVIDRFDGTVDKFIGDGIMVYWGAPLAQPNHAKLAVSCMLAMQEALLQLGVKWTKEGVEKFAIRGGAQSGEVVAGNIGFHGKKMEYTVIGDTVNQAARLEGTAKYYGVDFLVGESTYLATCDTYRYRELDRVRVVGKNMPIKIYQLLGTLVQPANEWIAKFDEALALYRKRRWDEAVQIFTSILDTLPDDKPSKIYLERCAYFQNHPPPEDWDGVFNRVDK